MSPEPIIDALLRVPGITAAVSGQSIALEQLAQGATYPAIVYRSVGTNAAYSRMDAPVNTYSSRVQINPLAASVAQVLSLHELVRAAVESAAVRTVAGRRLISARWAGLGPVSKDDFTGMWTQPVDYILIHE